MARRQAPGTKQRVLVVADRLFGRHGVRSVVMQQLVDETLLKHSLAQLSPNYAERYSCTCIGSKSRGQGIRRTTVEHGDRGRLRPDIWQAWHDANDTDRRHRCIRVLRSPSDRATKPGHTERGAHQTRDTSRKPPTTHTSPKSSAKDRRPPWPPRDRRGSVRGSTGTRRLYGLLPAIGAVAAGGNRFVRIPGSIDGNEFDARLTRRSTPSAAAASSSRSRSATAPRSRCRR